MTQATFTERASGILMPTATLDKEQYTLPNADFQKLTRLMKHALTFELLVRYYCGRCKAPVRLRRAEQIVTDMTAEDGTTQPADGGRLSMSCDCATWAVTPPAGGWRRK